MKILQITDGIPPATLGGSGRIVWEIATGLVRQNHDVTILTAAQKGSVPAEKEGVHIRTITPRPQRFAHYRSVFSPSRAHEVLAHIEDVQPDIIHAHVIAWQAGYRWIESAHRLGIPVIITCHDVMNVAYGRVRPGEFQTELRDALRFRWSWNPFRNSFIRKTLNHACTVLTVSNALREHMEKKGFTNLRTVHNGIDLTFWKEEDKTTAQRALDLPANIPVFLLAGRLGVDKGTDAITRILPDNALLLIAGDADLSAFDSIKNRIRFLGKCDPAHMRTVYAASDTVLVPSRCLDCFPTVSLEAMACSRPVVVTNWGGAKEAVLEEKTGWVIDPLDEAAWKKRLIWCTQHENELMDMGKTARLHMEQRFSQDRFLADLHVIYEEALGTL